MPIAAAILQLLLAAAATYAFGVTVPPVVAAFYFDLDALPVVGGLLFFLLTVLQGLITSLPVLLLSVLWLRSLGGAPRPAGAGPALHAFWRAALWLLLLLLVNAVAQFVLTLFWGLLAKALFSIDETALGNDGLLLLWVQVGSGTLVAILVFMAFLPGLLTRMAAAPTPLGYGGDRRWLRSFGVCLLGVLLSYLLFRLGALLPPPPPGDGPAVWLPGALRSLIELWPIPLCFLLVWRILRPAALPRLAPSP